NGNVVIDAFFGAITDAKALEKQLKMIPGVVETGLFIGSTTTAYIGTKTSVIKLRRKRNSS
ncbi:MAG: ribose-5-phosphate isomerase A, partial [Candidatus Bathyarchaeia archaeon]